MRVIVAAENDVASEVRAHLCSWSRAGLLGEFCWWPTSPQGADGSFTVQRVVLGETRAEALSMALDPIDPELVRLVGFYASANGFDERFAAALADRVAAAADVFRFRDGRPVRPALIVAPAALGEQVPPGLFKSNWLANVLIVPEDRRTPTSPNALADTPEMYAAHAANALATTADLWRDERPGRRSVLDGLAPRPGGPAPVLVVPTRCYSRIVDLGYLPDHLAASVFERTGDGWPNPKKERYDRRSHPDDLLTYLTRQYLRKHEAVLGITPFQPVELPERPRLTILEALRWLWRELIRTLKRKPVEFAEGLLASAVDRTAGLIERLAPDRPFDVVRWRERARDHGDLSGLRADLERPLVAEPAGVAETWRDLRLLAFGLIDGATLPEGIDADAAKLGDRRLVVTAPGKIVPDPAPFQHPLPDGSMARACDPRNLRSRDELLPSKEDAAEQTSSDVSDPVPPAPERPDGPIWMVGESITEELLKAQAGAADPPAEPDEPATLGEEERRRAEKALRKQAKRARRRGRVRLLVRGLLPMIVFGGVSWAVWTRLPLLLAIPAQGLLVIVLAAVYARMAQRRFARRQRDAREAAAAELAKLNATLERSLRKGDALRLEARYEEYLDWAELIGWFAHHPWVGEALHRVDVRSPIDLDTLPASMAVALGRVGEHVEKLRRQGQRQLFGPRWLSDLYAAVEHSVTDELRQEEDEATGATAATRRTPAAATGLDSDRQLLLDATRVGRYRHLQDNELCRKLLTFLDGVQLDFVTDGVVPARQGEDQTDALPPATAWFSPPENLMELSRRLKPSIVRISTTARSGERFGGTGVLISRDGTIATARHVIEGAEEITVTFLDGATVPATVTSKAPGTDLAVIAATPPESASTAILSPATAEVTQGEPVITLGHPLLLEGEPTLAWGLITATDRHITIDAAPEGIGRFAVIQATYHSTGGASGSPVFDLKGRVIGIHSAGSRAAGDDPRAQYMSSAVPITELRALLAGKAQASPPSTELAAIVLPGGPGELPEATEFLNQIAVPVDGLSFLPDHWADPTRGRKHVEEALPSNQRLEGARARLGEAAGATRFLAPVRVVVHRVETAKPVPPRELACCAPALNPET